MTIPAWAWVAVGSAIGGASRYGTYLLFPPAAGDTFPWATLTVNIAGSLLIGCFAAFTGPHSRFAAAEEIRILLLPGVCGGFTTFSSFSLDLLRLLENGAPGKALIYALGSVLICLLAVWIGYSGSMRIAVPPSGV